MNPSDFSINIIVDQSPKNVFDAINNVRGWWSEQIEGATEKLNDVYTVRFGETYITAKVVEFIPSTKIVWYVIDCNKHWLKNKKEWKDTKMSWEIFSKNNTTQINFTHIGLIPGIECYNGCEKAWNFYITESLFKLLTEGKGKPELK